METTDGGSGSQTVDDDVGGAGMARHRDVESVGDEVWGGGGIRGHWSVGQSEHGDRRGRLPGGSGLTGAVGGCGRLAVGGWRLSHILM